MNNKGVITRGMAILAALILIIVLAIVIIINVGKSTNVNKYKSLDIDEGEEKKITLKTLSDSNLVYSDLKDKCDGYVIITNEEDLSSDKYELVYNAYIKCGRKYMTANYSEY